MESLFDEVFENDKCLPSDLQKHRCVRSCRFSVWHFRLSQKLFMIH